MDEGSVIINVDDMASPHEINVNTEVRRGRYKPTIGKGARSAELS